MTPQERAKKLATHIDGWVNEWVVRNAEEDLREFLEDEIMDAVAEEGEACAKIADQINKCFKDHHLECECTGRKQPTPFDIPDQIRARHKT